MKNLKKLLALMLAAVMLLSVDALAADDTEDGPRLVVRWLDWDEQNRCYASDDTLAAASGGSWDMGLDPTRHDCVIFFVQDGDKKTPVVPTGDGNVNASKVDKEAIAPGAKESDSYVQLEMKEFKDGAFTTTYQGKKLTIDVLAMLPDVGLYSTETASEKTLLPNDSDPSRLKDKTAYVIINSTDEVNGRHVTGVKKHGSDPYDLKKVSDDVYKIVITADEGGIGVNLDVSWLDAEGNAYDEERGWYLEYPQGPELWIRWLDSENGSLYIPEDAEAYDGFQSHPGDETNLIFYTCEYDSKGGQVLTPVLPKDLKGSAGVTITGVSDQSQDPMAKYFVNVTVDEWMKEYTITSGEYTMHFDSNLPDFGVYSKPELTPEAYTGGWKLSALDASSSTVTVYIGSYISEGENRKLEEIKFADFFPGKSAFTLERYNDNFYKLSTSNAGALVPWTAIPFVSTFKWEDGHTEDWDQELWIESKMAMFASETALPDFTDGGTHESRRYFGEVKGQVVNSITLKAGETKTIYIGHSYYYDWGGKAGWSASITSPELYVTSGALKLAKEGTHPSQYTVSCGTPGEYVISLCQDFSVTLYDANGKEIPKDSALDVDYDFQKGEWFVGTPGDGTTLIPDDGFDGTIDVKAEGIDADVVPIKVIVTGDAAKPAESGKTFPDVKDSDWFAAAAAFVNTNGYMGGNANGAFNPEGEIKGSEFTQILYNKEGKPAAADGAAFQGVDAQWYAPAILWAAGKGIITDSGDTAVVPEDTLTRQQIALMLYNYMGKPAASTDMSKFADSDKISAWAKDAMEWAVSEGVFQGNDNKGVLTLNPTGTARRSETAQILMNFFG